MSTLARVLFFMPLLALAVGPALAADSPPAALDVKHTQNVKVIPRWEVFEITFRHDGAYHNPFFDVTIDVTFTSPSGRKATVGGFHYGCLEKPEIIRKEVAGAQGGPPRVRPEYKFPKADTWKARFAPAEVGTWKYAYTFSNAKGGKATGEGEFACIVGRTPKRPLHGFVRQDPANPMRWVFDDGTPYFPIGYQDGQFDSQGLGTCLSVAAMEGPFRNDRPNLPPVPPGAMFRRGPAMNPQNTDVQFRRFARTGCNMLRFSQQNFSYTITPNLDRVNVMESLMTDDLLRQARKYGLRVFYGIFGYMNVRADHPEDAEAMAKVKRLVKYSVDRWGAYVDFWEFLNEQKADAGWYAIHAPYLKSIDPYHHPVTTSWERPELEGIDLSAPHQYVGINELGADMQIAGAAAGWKKHGKPVIVGEAGNVIGRATPEKPWPPGVGGVWDPGSAQRMRLRNWAGLFNEISFIFWNTSYARDGHNMNIWLGPREREYVRAMQDFAYALGGGVKMAAVAVSDHGVRAWGLANDRRAGAYLHHFRDHAAAAQGVTLTIDVPQAAKAYWYSPETAAILGKADAPPGRQTLAAPDFKVDIALLITPDGCPDIDKDGIPNDVDPDNDNDGVANEKDAFPLEPEEWADKDGDLIGDNLDADIDADGVGDDLNRNGIPDFEEMDFDGDGVPRTGAVPWDAFPLDPKEWRDTDGDGIGDNSDPDIDGDGWTNGEEKAVGTDPYDRLSFPVK
ncbi:MAG: DUF5060 domain-containing protein [Planctomycetota bacterium]|nr:DUF5060 domain-containing protein [Planctomycetota bacterium]